MKFTAPRPMAVFLSVLIALLTGLLTTIFIFSETSNFLEFWIVYILAIFIIFYVILYYALNSFIIQRIKPIYKTIHKTNVSDKKIREKLEDKDIIAVVNQEVSDWAQDKTREIMQLKKMAKYRKEFLGNVSHELKTPIFTMQGYILTLLDGGLEDPEINRKYLEKSEKSINRMISIVNDLETISQLEETELKLEFEDFNIIELINDAIELYEDSAAKKSITIYIKPNSISPVIVKANREKIFDLVTNLISNSIKYGRENGTTKIDFLDMDKNYLIEIEDNGIGIEKEHLPRIFERFYRVDASRSRERGGTGIGLAIVKHIIEAHKQTINCRSNPGAGTSFAFTLKKSQAKK